MSSHRGVRALVFAAALLLIPNSFAFAENSRSSTTAQSRPPTPLAITISGGGTKGAYMAGHLYYMAQVRRQSAGRFDPRVFTGASAGAINSFISVLTTCGGAEPDPTKSFFYEAWIPTGINELFVPEKTVATALFSPVGFERVLGKARETWRRGLPEDCDLLLGVAITRAFPRPVDLAPGFPSVARSLETVLLRITGRGPGRAPLVRNYVDPERPTPQVLMPVDGPAADGFEAIVPLILASSAFPVGFPPVKLPHCLSQPGQAARCTPGDAEEALFIDGGVFDNQPLGLAARGMQGIRPKKGGGWEIAEDFHRGPLPDQAQFYYVDPRVRSYPRLPANKEDPEVDDVLGVVMSLFRLLQSVESRELIAVFEQSPEVKDRLLLARTFFPPISDTFSGLIDRKFREFDFYLGMYDAARTIREHPDGGANLPRPEELFLKNGDPALAAAWKPFLCLRAVLDGEGAPAEVCAGDQLQDFRSLVQLSLDQLTDHCLRIARLSKDVPEVEHPQCQSIMQGDPAPRMHSVPELEDSERAKREGEGRLSHQLRLLAHYGFHFEDLGLEREDADLARDKLVRLGQQMMRQLSLVQPRNGLALGVIGRVGVDTALGYIPPQHIFRLSLGLGAEFGYSVTLDHPDWNWLRFQVAVALDGLSTLFNSSEDYLAVIPKGGIELELLGGPLLQFRVGALAGYQFSTADSLSTGTCDFSKEANTPCSRLAVELQVSATALGLVRFHIAGVYQPGLQTGQADRFAVRPMLGVQINSPF